MQNPFELIFQRLDRIESLISNLNTSLESTSKKNILNVIKLSEFLGLSKSSIYKLTSERKIPFFNKGKYLCFDEEEIIEWIKLGKVRTIDEVEMDYNP